MSAFVSVSEMHVRFAYPGLLLLLVLIPLVAWLSGRAHPKPALIFATLNLLPKNLRSPRARPRRFLPDLFRYFILAVLITALARPQLPRGDLPDHAKGVDIMFALDYSNSMNVKDYIWEGRQVSRLEALIEVIKEFVDGRENDRYGIVGFAQYAYLASPLTLDQKWIKAVLEDIPTATGTAVGDGVMLSVDYLKTNPEREKTIVLVSDGLSNRGVGPLEAAAYARDEGIRIYTIRVFPNLIPPSRYQQNVMFRVANETGGQFFQAADSATLRAVYNQIDLLETSRVEQNRQQVYRELFPWFLAVGGVCLIIELLLRQFMFRRIP